MQLYGHNGSIHTPVVPIHKSIFGELMLVRVQEQLLADCFVPGVVLMTVSVHACASSSEVPLDTARVLHGHLWMYNV